VLVGNNWHGKIICLPTARRSEYTNCGDNTPTFVPSSVGQSVGQLVDELSSFTNFHNQPHLHESAKRYICALQILVTSRI